MARRHHPLTSTASKNPSRELSARKGAPSGHSQPQDSPPAAVPSLAHWEWFYLAAIVTAVLLVYQPAWHGGFIWDDDAHVTKPELRSWQGLYRIWFQLGATQQYYPLLHSTFWVEQRLWGDALLGYHLTNILLHAAAAVLVALVLRRLRVPGAYLAAAIFALHPVHVESVAWITEQKNTLSAVFYLAAMLAYLRFDRTRNLACYGAALGLFLLGLLSKTTAATLPAALLVLFWWQRGRLSWRRDVGPLLPFFALGAVAGILTAWVERKLLGAEGAEFALSFVERCLIAGRAIWFYLGKLVWPTKLIFIYPRWQVSAAVWWQYLFPAAALLLLAGMWALRRRWRGPLAGLLFFVGTLLPALGFCNVYPFLYSFVADHFQYLASLGVITLASAGAALLLRRWPRWSHLFGCVVCLALLVGLGTLTWFQSRMYADVATLYRTTIDRNPTCWMAHNNLGLALAGRGQVDEAIAHYQQALTIKPDLATAYYNFAFVLAHLGRLDEAIAHYRKGLDFKPEDAEAHYQLGRALQMQGKIAEALAQFQQAVKIKPDYAEARNNLGASLQAQRRFDEAMVQYRQALEIKPDYAKVYYNLGTVLAGRGQFDQALAQFQRASELQPDDADTQNNLAWLLATCPAASLRSGAAAIEHAQRANQLCGGRRANVLNTLAAAYAEAGRFPEALAAARKALDVATQQKDQAIAGVSRAQIALYQAGKPFRQTQPAPAPRPPTH